MLGMLNVYSSPCAVTDIYPSHAKPVKSNGLSPNSPHSLTIEANNNPAARRNHTA